MLGNSNATPASVLQEQATAAIGVLQNTLLGKQELPNEPLLTKLVELGEQAQSMLKRENSSDPGKSKRVRLQTFNEQHDQEHFNLTTLPSQLRHVRSHDGDHDDSDVMGCPWCRRPVVVRTEEIDHRNRVQTSSSAVAGVPNPETRRVPRYAYVSVLYGTKHSYFLGAAVLAHSLRTSSFDKVILVTPDVSSGCREVLAHLYTDVIEVDYLSINKQISPALYKNPQTTRFGDVFTKLQVLSLTAYDKVMFLDLDTLVIDCPRLDRVFEEVQAPAALSRGDTGLQHGHPVPYRLFWEGYKRKAWPSGSWTGGSSNGQSKEMAVPRKWGMESVASTQGAQSDGSAGSHRTWAPEKQWRWSNQDGCWQEWCSKSGRWTAWTPQSGGEASQDALPGGDAVSWSRESAKGTEIAAEVTIADKHVTKSVVEIASGESADSAAVQACTKDADNEASSGAAAMWHEHLPSSEQANGINAGVMLLQPDLAALRLMKAECSQWEHPQHYPTYMPEQEYLGRFLACLDTRDATAKMGGVVGGGNPAPPAIGSSQGHSGWFHLSPAFNFEVDKNLRVPFDFSSEHARLQARSPGGINDASEIAVLHFSGCSCKPWAESFMALVQGPRDGAQEAANDSLSSAIEEELRHMWGKEEPTINRIAGNICTWLREFVDLQRALGRKL